MRVFKLILFSALVYSSSAFARGPEIEAGLFSFLKDLFKSSAATTTANNEPGGTYVPPTRPYVAPVETAVPESQGESVNVDNDGTAEVNRHTVCRVVNNDSTVQYGVFVPVNTPQEWAAFREGDTALGDRRQPLPPGVTLAACGPPPPPPPPPPGACGSRMSEGGIWSALGYDAQAQLTSASPRAGNRPRINATPATLNYICRSMGCGDHNWRSVRGWSSPSDNTLIDWNGSAWYKRPGNQEYGGVHLSTTSSTGQILSCAPL